MIVPIHCKMLLIGQNVHHEQLVLATNALRTKRWVWRFISAVPEVAPR
jgi:hypothetical protein